MQSIGTYGGGGLRTTRDGKALIGCLVVLGLLILLFIGGVIVVALNWKTWLADATATVTIQQIEQSDLPDEEKAQVVAQIERLSSDFKSGKLTLGDMQKVMESLAESPLVPAVIVYGAKRGYLDESELTDEEKAEGELAFSRVARGLFEKSITPERFKDVFEPIETTARSGPGVHIENPKFRLHLKPPEQCTPDELREVIANAQAAADEAGIPNERVELDVSDEIQKAIDEALGRGGSLPESDEANEGP